MSHDYTRIETACDLSQTSLQMAANELQPSRIFTLHVGAGYAYWAGKDLLADQHRREDNPLHPYINLIPEPDLKASEWYLEDEHGNKCGSEGA
jgi:hypothetical protein